MSLWACFSVLFSLYRIFIWLLIVASSRGNSGFGRSFLRIILLYAITYGWCNRLTLIILTWSRGIIARWANNTASGTIIIVRIALYTRASFLLITSIVSFLWHSAVLSGSTWVIYCFSVNIIGARSIAWSWCIICCCFYIVLIICCCCATICSVVLVDWFSRIINFSSLSFGICISRWIINFSISGYRVHSVTVITISCF